jgi:hypothetical protein
MGVMLIDPFILHFSAYIAILLSIYNIVWPRGLSEDNFLEYILENTIKTTDEILTP